MMGNSSSLPHEDPPLPLPPLPHCSSPSASLTPDPPNLASVSPPSQAAGFISRAFGINVATSPKEKIDLLIKENRDLYYSLASIPSIVGGHLIPKTNQLLVQYSQADLERGIKRTYLHYYQDTSQGLAGDGVNKIEQCSLFPQELHDVIVFSVSPSGRYVAIVRDTDPGKTKESLNNKSFATIEVRSPTSSRPTIYPPPIFLMPFSRLPSRFGMEVV